MARNRDPVRDKAKKLWKEAGGDKAPKGILKEIADKLALSEGTVRGWKAKDKWSIPKKKVMERSDKNMERSNEKIEEKKELIPDENKDYDWIDEIDGLSDKQRLFCYYYMESLNAFQAGIKAGYSPNYSRTRIYEMLENVSIKNFLKKLKEQQRQKFLISQERILNRHVQVAWSDINEYFNEDGSPKPITHTDGTLIKKMKITENDKGRTVEIELIEKCKSLDFLTTHSGLKIENKDNEKVSSIVEVRKKNDL